MSKGPTYGINGNFGAPEKKLSVNFRKENKKFCFSLRYNGDNSYLLVNGIEIFKFRADNKNVTFLIRSISNEFSNTESREVSLNRNYIIFQSIANLLTNLSY